MPYPEYLVAPMRQELTAVGARNAARPPTSTRVVKTAGRRHDGRQFRVRLRGRQGPPGHRAWRCSIANRPDTVATVFAGADIEATDRARQYFTGFAPSSPSIALLRDGKLVYMVERRDIETRSADGIADLLTMAFDQFCAPDGASELAQLARSPSV